MRRRGWLAAVLLTAAVSAHACRDIPAPEGGVLSVSRIQLPLPGVVAGDTMRDSTGAVAPVRIIAYGLNGQPLDPQPAPDFFVGDGAHFVLDSLLVGDSADRRVGIIASVGSIQTLPESVTVTRRPDTLVAADSTRHLRTWSLVTFDTVVNSAELTTIVQHREPGDTSGVNAVIVHYEILSAPAPTATGTDPGPSIQIMNGNRVSARDTTSGGGRAARVARLRVAAFSGLLDSAVVRATASYRGATLGSVQFTIVFQRPQ